MKHLHNTLARYIAGLITIIYTFSLIVSLIAGVSHELHHLLSHTLDQHHHHGESHSNQSSQNKTHQHINLVDILLDDARSQKDKKEDQSYLSFQRIFYHTGINISRDRIIYSENHDFLFPMTLKIQSQYLSLPDIPPPKA